MFVVTGTNNEKVKKKFVVTNFNWVRSYKLRTTGLIDPLHVSFFIVPDCREPEQIQIGFAEYFHWLAS